MKDSFFSGMSDDEFIDFLSKAYNGMTVAALKKFDRTAYKKIYRRKLSEELQRKGIITSSKRTIKVMSDNELIDFVKRNYNGYTLGQLSEKDSTIAAIVNSRGLVDHLDEKGIITRSRRAQGAIKYASNRELIDLTKRDYKGLRIVDIADKDPSLLNELRKRRLVEGLVKDRTIVRVNKPRGFFERLTNKQLVDYAAKNYNGQTITEAEDKDNALLIRLRKRGLVDTLVQRGIFVRKARNKNIFRDMTDPQVIKYLKQNHLGHSLTEVCYEDKTVYRELKRRGLDSKLIDNGILVKKAKTPHGTFSKMSNKELLGYFRINCQDMSLSYFQTKEGMAHNRAYQIARERGLVEKLLEEGTLIRKHYGNKVAPNPIDLIEQDETATAIASLAGLTDDVQNVAELLSQMWPNRFPSASKLAKSLPGAIERIGKHLQPFSFQKASSLYEKIRNVSRKVYTALDDILFNIMVDQYQITFNQDPKEAMQELSRFSRTKGPVSKLAQKVSDYYGEVYQFAIPGHGKISPYRRGA